MTNAFDPRIVRVGIEIEGETFFFEDLDIRAQGVKYANPLPGQCTIKISNLKRDTRNYILTKATPVTGPKHPTRTPVNVTLDVGRASFTPFRLFTGQVVTSTVTPPPDIGIVLRSLTNSAMTQFIDNISESATVPMSQIAEQVAQKNNLTLRFEAQDRMIGNFSFTGAVGRLPERLQLFGGVRVYVDNDSLIVTDADKPRSGVRYELNLNTGMVGVPQACESGCIAQMLIKPGILVGGAVSVKSQINPAVNGDTYNISQLNFDIANRDVPFYYTMLLSNYFYQNGTT